jgi:hypothetical protein
MGDRNKKWVVQHEISVGRKCGMRGLVRYTPEKPTKLKSAAGKAGGIQLICSSTTSG